MSGSYTTLKTLAVIPQYTPAALALTRVLLTPVIMALLRAASPLALPLYVAALATDLLDGKAARLLGSSSNEGAALDAGADFLLVAAGFTHYAFAGLVSPLLLGLMASSFLQYFATINLPIKGSLGKHVGTLLFTLLGALIINPSAHIGAVANAAGCAYLVAALIHRNWLIRRHRGPWRSAPQPPPNPRPAAMDIDHRSHHHRLKDLEKGSVQQKMPEKR